MHLSIRGFSPDINPMGKVGRPKVAKPRSAEQATKQRSLMQEAWLQFKSNRLAICGLIVIGLLLLISIAD